MSLGPAMTTVEEPRRVLLVGNYAPDGQESMLRFARMLRDGLPALGWEVELIAPGVRFGKGKPANSGVGKWLAYVDKYLCFPRELRARARALSLGAVVHICDHSNAMYAPAAASAGARVIVTCHDLGAVRGALGESTDCPASATGKVLQRWIARSLGLADLIACVSDATRRDVAWLIRTPAGKPPDARTVPLGLNVPYGPLDAQETAARLAGIAGLDAGKPFALNVGSSLRRKNREGVLRIFARVKDRFAGQLVFAGEGLPPELTQMAGELGIAERIVQVVKPSDAALEALYNRALALVFPSRFEGFGWPVIEAQACGCPVLCSDAGALGEVAGDSAFVRPPDDEAAFAEELLRLQDDPAARAAWKEKGFRNLERFRAETMIGQYSQLYRELARP
jgi:glycosyltransferase involved in cell wall biosynthesis